MSEPNAKMLYSDNGTEFKNSDVQNWSEGEGIVQKFNIPYTPRDSGEVEAFNRTIKLILTMMKITYPDKSTENLLHVAISVYNTEREHTSTRYIPIKLNLFGSDVD